MPENSVTISVHQYADLIREAAAGRMLMNLLEGKAKHYHGFTHEEVRLLSHLLNGAEEEA